MDKKNILFLSYGEDIFQNPILQNQFIGFAENFDSQKYNIHIYSALPISRTRLFKNKEWQQKLNALKSRLSEKNIMHHSTTLLVLANWLYSTVWQFFLFHTPWQQIRLALYIKKHKIKYVYCRSYHAAFIALRVRHLFGQSYKVHFDPRSLFVEEGQLLGRIGILSRWLWHLVERMNYQRADLVSFVSQPFLQMQQQKFKIKKAILMYTHSSVEQIELNKNKALSPLRLCYLGQIDHTGWHQIKPLMDLFEAVQKKIPEAHLRIITQSDPHALLQEQQNRQLKNIEIVSSSSLSQSSQCMADAHFGLLTYKSLTSPLEEKIAKTVVGSKSGEYLAAGLPILCNRNLHGIAELLEKQNVGICYSLGQEAEVPAKILSALENYQPLSERCRRAAMDHFDIHKNIQIVSREVDQLCAP